MFTIHLDTTQNKSTPGLLICCVYCQTIFTESFPRFTQVEDEEEQMSFLGSLNYIPNPPEVPGLVDRRLLVRSAPSEEFFTNSQNKNFKSQDETAKATRVVHDGKRRYECSACGLRKASRPAIQSHILKDHLGEAGKGCDCGYSTCNMDCWNQHLKRCKDRLVCPKCGYRTTKTSNLKRHMLTHVTTGTTLHEN